MYVRKFESHVQFANRCVPRKISYGAENFVLQALQFQLPYTKHRFQQLTHCCVRTLLCDGSGTVVFSQPLPTNDCSFGSLILAIRSQVPNIKCSYVRAIELFSG
jgi:hypothetical protein